MLKKKRPKQTSELTRIKRMLVLLAKTKALRLEQLRVAMYALARHTFSDFSHVPTKDFDIDLDIKATNASEILHAFARMRPKLIVNKKVGRTVHRRWRKLPDDYAAVTLPKASKSKGKKSGK